MRLPAVAAVLGLAVAAAASVPAQPLTGAGASAPAPVYQKWGEAAATPLGLTLNYQAIGSGGGINQVLNRTVSFGATDAPLSRGRLERENLLQFPTLVGGIVLAVNLPGIGDGVLRLTGETVAAIFQGRLSRWNDPRIAALNPTISLPDLPLAPVYRADASGTTQQFTDYLARVSPDWREQVGSAASVRWPAGIGARGNDGVAGTVRNARGGIGYLEYAYAKLNRLAIVRLRNRDGAFVAATQGGFLAAATGADWNPAAGFAVVLNDRPGPATWPITAATFILVSRDAPRLAETQRVLRFFGWALREGDRAASELGFVPLPEVAKRAVEAAWAEAFGPHGD